VSKLLVSVNNRFGDSTMKKQVVYALVGVNLLLGAGLMVRAFMDTKANAQPAAQTPRRPGDYLLIPGRATGATVDIVYVLDQQNRELGAIAEDNKKISAMPVIKLDPIFDEAAPPPDNNRRRTPNQRR
jgi:hypothetical protein